MDLSSSLASHLCHIKQRGQQGSRTLGLNSYSWLWQIYCLITCGRDPGVSNPLQFSICCHFVGVSYPELRRPCKWLRVIKEHPESDTGGRAWLWLLLRLSAGSIPIDTPTQHKKSTSIQDIDIQARPGGVCCPLSPSVTQAWQ